MPFDGQPENFQTTKPDVFSLEGLIAWLETQNPTTTYNFIDGRDCLLSRYLTANGHTNVIVGGWGIGRSDQTPNFQFDFEAWGKFPGRDRPAVSRPSIYGAALKRARALLAIK